MTICDKVRAVLEGGGMDFDALVIALPDLTKQQISGALCNLWDSGWLLRSGTTMRRFYEKRAVATPVKKPPRNPNIVPPKYQPSVFIGTLALKPHILDPRADYREQESLAMLAR